MRSSIASRKTRGRPRDSRIEQDVVAAVLKVLRVHGYRAVTIENIARRVRRARTSLYRRWPSKRQLVAFAVVHELGVEPAPDTGSLREDLKAAVETLRRAFAGPLGTAIAGLASDMAHDAALGCLIRSAVLAPRRDSMRAALARGAVRGEIARGLDVELLLDMLTAPFYFRTLFGHAQVTAGMSGHAVDYALRAAAPQARNNT
ncbi:MAG TPA: TetR/AcrR family transcriptional regulator [Steroidobacteraceae bacterium]|nr:TetR/AcrR family transcriptional regulator [Steroidobacteraceae bacterium]